MKLYVWLSFAFMGWAYYEMSGGADFVPEQTASAEVETDTTPDLVTRADTATLLSVSTSNVTPVIEAVEIPADPAVSDEVLAAALSVTPAPEAVEEAPAPLDLRYVAGARVNMRQGPSTNHGVIVTLPQGTEVEVMEVNADGWAHLRDTQSGTEGWMAERLLSDPQT